MTALPLASHGFGDRLCAAINGPHDDALDHIVQSWRAEIITCLRDDPFGILHKHHPALANSVPTNFPRRDIVQAFLHPVISSSNTLQDILWPLRPPSLSKLASLCDRYFSWSTPSMILQYFKKDIWPAMVIRPLVCEVFNSSSTSCVSSEVCGFLFTTIYLSYECDCRKFCFELSSIKLTFTVIVLHVDFSSLP